jgi:hypothetical protein
MLSRFSPAEPREKRGGFRRLDLCELIRRLGLSLSHWAGRENSVHLGTELLVAKAAKFEQSDAEPTRYTSVLLNIHGRLELADSPWRIQGRLLHIGPGTTVALSRAKQC